MLAFWANLNNVSESMNHSPLAISICRLKRGSNQHDPRTGTGSFSDDKATVDNGIAFHDEFGRHLDAAGSQENL